VKGLPYWDYDRSLRHEPGLGAAFACVVLASGGFAAKAWAFCTLAGDRVLCIFAESDTQGNNPGKQALYFRGECPNTLWAMAGTSTARRYVVAALVPELFPSP